MKYQEWDSWQAGEMGPYNCNYKLSLQLGIAKWFVLILLFLQEGETALMVAVETKELHIIRFLKERGADLNAHSEVSIFW